MRLRPSNGRCVVMRAVVCAGLFVASLAPAAGPPRPPQGKSITFSSTGEGGTNLNQLNSRRDGLRQLEEELNKSLQPFSHGSLDGMPVPPMRPIQRAVVPNKRTQELIERRKNWALLSPDEMFATPGMEDFLGVSSYDKDGLPKRKASPVEEFLYPQGARDKDKDREGANETGAARPGTDASEDKEAPDAANLPAGIRESQQRLREKLSANSFGGGGSPSGRSSLSDIFGLNSSLPTELDLAEKARREEWRNRWNTPKSTPEAANSLNSLFDSPRAPATAIAVTPVMEAPVTRRDLPNTPAVALGNPQTSLLDPKSYGGNTVLNPAVNLPKLEPPKLTPPTPTFAAPRRGFY